MLVALLERCEDGLEGGLVPCGELGDAGYPLYNLRSDVGQLIGRYPNKTAQMSGADCYLRPKLVEACLDVLHHRRFDD